MIMVKVFRARLEPMSFMMISMYTGMSVGLTSGILLGSKYQGDLFLSTALSIGIGAFCGFLIGIFHSSLSAIEGIMAGLMGGMMGAMLGDMIPITETIKMIKIFMLLSISSLFLFFILPGRPSSQPFVTKKWLVKPLFISIVYLTMFVSVERLISAPVSYDITKPPNDSNSHTHGEDPNHLNDIPTKNIVTINMHYQPSILTVDKDILTKIVLYNEDQIEHDIEIKNIAADRFDNHSGQKPRTSSTKSTLHLHADANRSNQLEFVPTESGVYEFYCTIPGHKESGMSGTLIVN
ncbi:plastocyanin/azurin family copper-binding protein [Rossellomorea vietnamensis]|uniref:plastocyanin/azurin family copper-binding protein n=1 Tax=Rossellomorea vietnamensis TaxID=218284 RepID=UPI00142F71B8|nr:plastocyanin/azurin family copper-binding protein [Rossellomorea vietnamensis]